MNEDDSRDILEYFADTIDKIVEKQLSQIELMVEELRTVRDNCGRLFIIGNGGGAAHASHAACDFRKLTGIEAWAFDNVAELTAGVNDGGWENICWTWLSQSNLCASDAILVISVGGGDKGPWISPNLIGAIDFAIRVDAKILAIVGPRGGYAKKTADRCVVIPAPHMLETPVTEGIQSVILHMLVSHPKLAMARPKWESTNE